ncbi:bla regulator protein BlaR1 [Anoxybacillus tengchongensis]|uniref:Bla regulator protein BlaR1 n=1 Tax=Anoxybacillus tengchongensis TaxID=576944 RepID=A0A7X0D9U0_9BACL|nr:transcriptional regulator [Anoxybacillus tengchongensis]MBB6177018.1 bla regulator protein BlaR1 [Anoxybacillus tengchongensis]
MRRFVLIFIFLILVIIVGLFFYQGNDFKKNDSISSSDEDIASLHTVKGVIDVEKAVGEAIKDHGKSYRKGEYIAEGHIILSTEQKANEVKVYAIASVGVFEFQDRMFAIVSGSGAIPTVVTFSVGKHGRYKLVAYEEPIDGDKYTESIKRMFPKKHHLKVLYAEKYYDELVKQQEEQAKEYLKKIGRDAKVITSYVEKRPLNISIQAMNYFLQMRSSDPFLNECPDWLGTREVIEKGVRYVYETSQSKTNDGRDAVVLRKMKEDGTIIEMRKYVIEENQIKRTEE